MPQNQSEPGRLEGESMDAYVRRIRQVTRSEPQYTSTSGEWQSVSYADTANIQILQTDSSSKPLLADPHSKKLILATRAILEARATHSPRPHAERRERDYISLIQSQELNRQTPRELLRSETPVYLPYVGYETLKKLEPLTQGRLLNKKDDTGWYIISTKTDSEIPLDYAFMCMGGFYEATEVPVPQLCARCEYVRPYCTQNKDYLGKDIFLCDGCLSCQAYNCDDCGAQIPLPYFAQGLCNNCIEKVDTSRPYRTFYKGIKWCGIQAGKIMQSPRIFSFEIEGVLASHSHLSVLVKTLVPEAGLSSDSSIRGDGLAIEVQSPQLAGARGEEFTSRVSAVLKDAGISINESCGMHVHLDGKGIIPLRRQDTPVALKDLWKAHLIFEDVVFSLLPFSRRLNRFCRPMRDYFKVSEIEMIETMFDAEKLWYKQQDADSIRSEKQHHHHASRYFGVNLHSLFADNHLELRHHSGTAKAKKVLEWANLHALIMDAAQAGKFTHTLLAEAQATTSIKDKTSMLFDAISLGNAQRQYFYQRQSGFSDKGKNEDGVNPLPMLVNRFFDETPPDFGAL